MNIEQVSSASTSELVAFYNKNCECFGKKQVKKFADRTTAQLRVRQMIEDIEAEQAELAVSSAPSQLAICLGLAPASSATEGMVCGEVTTKAVFEDEVSPYNRTTCPQCGSEELYSGRCESGFVVDENLVGGCHHCDWEYDVRSSKKSPAPTGEVREAMITSLKLDRTITAYDESMAQIGVWKNACQMWKQNLDWMTSAQQDGLTAKLYKAAKAGEKIRVVINGRTFELVNV